MECDTVILHTETNDLKDSSVNEAANRLADITQTLVWNGKKVVVSLLLPGESIMINNKAGHDING